LNQAEWAISKAVRRLSFYPNHISARVPLTILYCQVVVLCAIYLVFETGIALATNGDAHELHEHKAGLIGLLGRLHPIAVHFPIALILAAGLAEALCIWRKNPSFGFAARFLLLIGAIGAVISVLLGWAAATGRTPEPGEAVGVHASFGIVTTGLVLLTAALAQTAKNRQDPVLVTLYRVILLVSMITVGIAAHTGAILVFGRFAFF